MHRDSFPTPQWQLCSEQGVWAVWLIAVRCWLSCRASCPMGSRGAARLQVQVDLQLSCVCRAAAPSRCSVVAWQCTELWVPQPGFKRAPAAAAPHHGRRRRLAAGTGRRLAGAADPNTGPCSGGAGGQRPRPPRRRQVPPCGARSLPRRRQQHWRAVCPIAHTAGAPGDRKRCDCRVYSPCHGPGPRRGAASPGAASRPRCHNRRRRAAGRHPGVGRRAVGDGLQGRRGAPLLRRRRRALHSGRESGGRCGG